MSDANLFTKLTKSLIPTSKPLIDSLQLSIPLDLIEYVDEKIISNTQIVYVNSGEINDNEMPPLPYVLEFNGCTFRFWRTVRQRFNVETKKNDIQVEEINFTMSAKLLYHRYFEGITRFNIEYYYNNLIDLNIIKIDFDNFLQSYVRDIDICINTYSTQKKFSSLIDYLFDSVLITKKRLCDKVDTSSNQSIWFNLRRYANSKSPHFKIYNKELELLNKSTKFYDNYIFPYLEDSTVLNGLIRAEFTIKNYNHKKYLEKHKLINHHFKTLDELLNHPLNELYNVVCSEGLPNYLKNHKFRPTGKHSPTDTMFLTFIDFSIQKGLTEDEILDFTTLIQSENSKSDEVNRSRMKKRFKKLLNFYRYQDIENQKQMESNDSIKEILNTLNYFNYLKPVEL